MLFPKIPTIHIEPEQTVCSCEGCPKLEVLKTKTREVRTMHIGHFYAHETEKYCPSCGKKYQYNGLDSFVSSGANFGYDVVEYIGHAFWHKSQTAFQIQTDLKQQHNLTISGSEVTVLAKKFIHYLAEAQKDKMSEIKQFLQGHGGYFLYFDAMHPGDGSEHMMCAIAEEISKKVNFVLGSVKLPEESTETVAAFLRELKEKYGSPLAGICDMLASNLAAFREVFPDVLLLICHFHFLRSVGKEFLEYENVRLQNVIKQYDVTKRLKEYLRKCQERIEADPQLANYLTCDAQTYHSCFQELPGVVKTYCKIQWILAYEQELNGYGAPFDRADLVYLQRMKKTYESLKEYSSDCEALTELKYLLASLLEDTDLKRHMAAMERKVEDFDHLRAIMQIAPAEGGKGLNDDGEECDMTVMEEQLKTFIKSDKIKNNPDSAYRKMIAQILKYWKMLFAKPIEAKLPNGEIVLVYPQRTTNLMERLFREFQRSEYKRTGMSTLGRTARAMVAETPMIKNLECPEFMNIILNGQPTLAARFAELDIERIKERVKESSCKKKLPAGLKKIMNDSDFHKVFRRAAEVAELAKKAA